MVKNKYKNNSSESRGFQGIIKKLGQLLCYCLKYLEISKYNRTFAIDKILSVCRVNMEETNNILSLLEAYTLDNVDDVAQGIANDFRKRRIEKNLTREQVAEKSGVAVSNIVRFEQKGLISLKNLIGLAMALGYTAELKNIFAQPKYATMEELMQIRKNTNKKKAHKV